MLSSLYDYTQNFIWRWILTKTKHKMVNDITEATHVSHCISQQN